MEKNSSIQNPFLICNKNYIFDKYHKKEATKKL